MNGMDALITQQIYHADTSYNRSKGESIDYGVIATVCIMDILWNYKKRLCIYQAIFSD